MEQGGRPVPRQGIVGRVAETLTNRVTDVVDPDAILDHVDVDRLLDRVDVNRFLDRVDVNHLLERVDVERLLDRVDVDALVRRAGIPEIVADSTGMFADSTLDLLRRQIAGLDTVTYRVLQRLIGRDPSRMPIAPRELAAELGTTPRRVGTRREVTGHYAGPLSRAIALAIDVAASNSLFALGTAALNWVISTLTPFSLSFDQHGLAWLTTFLTWLFLYYWVGVAMIGKTVGKAVVGLRVVARDGTPLPAGRAVVRVLVLPISTFALGLGMLGAAFGRERRTLHDVAAGSAEVYDWGGRSAELPTLVSTHLERRGA